MRLFLIIVIFVPILLSAQPKSAADIYGAGVRAYYAADYQTALQKYSDALRLKPNTIGYLYSRGLTYQKLGLDSSAEMDFRKVTALDPKYMDGWFQLGMVEINQKRYDSAYNAFNKVLAIDPDDIKALHQLGLVTYYRHKYIDAIDIYTKILKLSPDDEQAYFKRGLVKFNDDNFDGAAKDFGESYRINPNNTLALEQRALSLLRFNDLEGACRDWDILAKKGNPRAQSNLSTYCGKQ
jgi:tetratricopeptide (TPR) repeat protein